MVDLPIPLLFAEMISCTRREKLAHLWNVFKLQRGPPALTQIFEDDREKYMLAELENEIRYPLQESTEKGILVVGLDHAVSYYNRLYETQIKV